MKSKRTIQVSALLVLVFYLGGYWLFIKRDFVSKLAPSVDPFQTSNIQRLIKGVFEPAHEVDLRVTHDRPLRDHLTGYWSSPSTSAFVHLRQDRSCEFRIGDFSYEGPVEYDRDYSGFFVNFSHEGRPYIFILSDVSGMETPDLNDDIAIGFIGHDPKPLYRETDHEIELTKTNKTDAGNGSKAICRVSNVLRSPSPDPKR
jgi:hypothetical protein